MKKYGGVEIPNALRASARVFGTTRSHSIFFFKKRT